MKRKKNDSRAGNPSVSQRCESTRVKIESCVPMSLAALFSNEPVHIYPLSVFSRWPAAPFFIDPISTVSVVALQASYLSDQACCLPGQLPGRALVCVSALAYALVTVRVCVILVCAVYYLTWRGKMSECKMSRVTYSVSWLLQGPAGQTQALFSIKNLHSESPPNNSLQIHQQCSLVFISLSKLWRNFLLDWMYYFAKIPF